MAEKFKNDFGSLFQIELDALQLVNLAKFQKEITSEVDKLFDQDVYDEVLDRPEYSQKPREIRSQIVDALNDLIIDFESDDEAEPEDQDEE